jgi:imidazolonepropionase
LEIAAAGGGIARTVRATREASEDALVATALPRLVRLLRHGVTTAEVKSGYGLSVESELKMLRVVRTLSERQPVSLVGTVLGLHALPPDHAGSREAYVRMVIDELLPQVVQAGLARFCDVFVEQSAFTHQEARACLTAAKTLGLLPRLHVDQLTPNGGAELAAELGAVTADHLEQISPRGIAALARAGTVAVLAPTSTLFVRARPYAPGRALREAGVPVALCTNVNPGSSNSENVFLAMGLACVENGLSPAEAYLGFTRFGGLALCDESLGRLTVGGPADLVVFAADSYRALPYHFAMNAVAQVVKAGQLVA